MATIDDEEQAIHELVARLDDGEDPLHMDSTPAVQALARRGLAVIPHLLLPLDSPDQMTRLHAQRALEGALSVHLGFVAGRGWTRPGGEQAWRSLWVDNGSYDFQAAPEARRRAIAAWGAWAAAQGSGPTAS